MKCFVKRIFALTSAVIMMLSSLSMVTYAKSSKKLKADDFVHTDGTKIIGTDGKELILRGMAFTNDILAYSPYPDMTYSDEKAYKELAEMGFNSVRFHISYQAFEDDSKPYSYKKSGFDWLDKNIKWAKKYGIGIIINMHCPQGGFQSLGEGLKLWTDKDCQDRLTALWKKIAKRYANEPTVLGYGLINEPNIPTLKTEKKTLEQYNKLMNRLAKAVRKVAPYQMIFVEPIGYSIDDNGKATYYDTDSSYAKIDDDNVVYEFHKYDTYSYTHQNQEWAGTAGRTMSYPSREIIGGDYIKWVGLTQGNKKSQSGGWTYYESNILTATGDSNVLNAVVMASALGDGKSAYFDDITVTEISKNGKEQVIFKADFSDGALNGSSWSADGSGTTVYYAEDGHNEKGCLKISGSKADYVHNFSSVEMKKGCKYKVSGYVKSDGGNIQIRMDRALYENYDTFDKEYLESGFEDYIKLSEERNAPLYLGEFGLIQSCFEDSRGGIEWVSDMISICEKYGISYDYFGYSTETFGLYTDYPNGLNKELKKAFKKLQK